MLAPSDRSTYLEALRPPAGCKLDFAIGTTFSLDLTSLLMVPLAFATFDWQDSPDKALADPVALLEALRRYADRTVLFCQEGRIALPARQHPLFAHLEKAVVQVRPKSQSGVFHAKTWLLRFVGPGTEAPIYRFLCLSRNLTSDRSWDTLLALEGAVVTDRQRAFARNHPLGEFIEALPGLARQTMSPAASDMMAMMATEVRRVQFEAPEPFEEVVAFHPIGLGRRFTGLAGCDRLLVVSPFLARAWLSGMDGSKNVLVSRSESLDELDAEALAGFSDVRVLDEGATEEDSDPVPDSGGRVEDPSKGKGLHAKLFVAERGWAASVFTGSANATNAAFESNVEFLVELTGKRSKVGIKAFLESGLANLLRPYSAATKALEASDEEVQAERRLETLRRTLAGASFRLAVSQGPETGTFSLALIADRPLALDLSGITARCWPITISTGSARDLAGLAARGQIEFVTSLEALTTFMAFELAIPTASREFSAGFVLNLPITGLPENRMQALLGSILCDRARLLRHLMFLLADEYDIAALGTGLLAVTEGEKVAAPGQGADHPALLEELLRALSRAPERLDRIHNLVEDLRKTEAGRSVLPEGFSSIWEPLWKARQEVKS